MIAGGYNQVTVIAERGTGSGVCDLQTAEPQPPHILRRTSCPAVSRYYSWLVWRVLWPHAHHHRRNRNQWWFRSWSKTRFIPNTNFKTVGRAWSARRFYPFNSKAIQACQRSLNRSRLAVLTCCIFRNSGTIWIALKQKCLKNGIFASCVCSFEIEIRAFASRLNWRILCYVIRNHFLQSPFWWLLVPAPRKRWARSLLIRCIINLANRRVVRTVIRTAHLTNDATHQTLKYQEIRTIHRRLGAPPIPPRHSFGFTRNIQNCHFNPPPPSNQNTGGGAIAAVRPDRFFSKVASRQPLARAQQC